MANHTTPCPDKAKIDALASDASARIKKVRKNIQNNAALGNLADELDVAIEDLDAIQSDPHHL
jgi:hypothetical protein